MSESEVPGRSPLHRRALSPDEHLSTDEMAELVTELEHVDLLATAKDRRRVVQTVDVLSERLLGRDRPKDEALRGRLRALRAKASRD